MKKYSYLIIFIALASCTPARMLTYQKPASLSVTGKRYAAFYQQQSAEYRALCYQAFNMARTRVDEWQIGTRRVAIVTDVDETILDNSPYAVHMTAKGTDHTASEWQAWTAKGICDTVPGALSFLQYASAKGIEIYYLTNRLESEKEGTLKNLRLYNFPNADADHLLLKRVANKEARRNDVAKTHDILLLMGDNLSDFSRLFDLQTPTQRKANTDSVAQLFGKRFIILPNNTYGDWESAVLNHKYNLTLSQKDSIIEATLKGY